MGNIKAFVAALVLAVGLAVLGSTPPPAKGPSAPAEGFSAGRAMADVKRIGRHPHPSGSREHATVRSHLVQRLRAMGLIVRTQDGAFPQEMRAWFNRHNGTAADTIPLVNVIGLLPGREPALPAVALMAHYDSVPGSPAAADDGAGVAAILETVRALSLDPARRRDVIVILTDGEEAGLTGAKLFFAEAPERRRIGAVVNLEARGGGGKANLFQTSSLNGDVARAWAATAPHPAGTSLATFIYSVLPNDTDLSVALPRGYAAWNIAFIGRAHLYHSPLATPQALDTGALQQMGEQALGLARALSQAAQLPGRAPDIVFFDVFGLFVLHYATAWGWGMLAVALIGYGALAARRFDIRELAGGAGRMLALVAISGGGLYLLNLLSGAGPAADYYDRLAAIPRLQAMALCACLAAGILIAGRKPATPSGEAGFAVPLWVAGAALQALAPVAAYVLTIPLMLGGVVALLRLRGNAGLAAGAVVAPLVGGYGLMLGYTLMQAVGPMLPMVAVLPLATTWLAFLQLRPAITRSAPLAAVLLAGAVALALWVRLDAPAASIPTYSEARAPSARK
ncbi:M28 family peptidase [Novosphingobium silvae]|uniref:M28 family peptidase n=1 Tax=Novosphingobium silvae TaxID=2692619 RepID=UPI001928ACDC|nr:M28 family peptidase [Novosphingobium silvae]